MDLTQTIWNAFEIERLSVEQLIRISSMIDVEKADVGRLAEANDGLAMLACVIVAILQEKSISSVGEELYSRINRLIVEKNKSQADNNNGQALYDKIEKRNGKSRFVIARRRGGFDFTLKASTGEVLAISELYSTMNSCINGIESLKRHSDSAIDDLTDEGAKKASNPKYEIYKDHRGEYRFRLKARNGEIMVVSEGYKSIDACTRAIEIIRSTAKSAYTEKSE